MTCLENHAALQYQATVQRAACLQLEQFALPALAEASEEASGLSRFSAGEGAVLNSLVSAFPIPVVAGHPEP
jgi:hypothetical protein